MIKYINLAIIGVLSTTALAQIASQAAGIEWMTSRFDSVPTQETSSSGGSRGWFGRTGSGFGFGK